MAEEQKPAEVPKDTPVAAEAATETTPAAEPAAAAPAETTTEAAAADVAADPVEAAAPVEEPKKEEEEVKPIEEGNLEHKAQGANFPKNLFSSKKFFWFGTDAVEVKGISAFKADKSPEVAHAIAAWAAETGKGLLFFTEKSEDKSVPHGAVLLSEASEPVVDGTHKFHFTSKGHKHTFKAANTAERDNWVAQLKLKIAEAKELATTVVESETYKKTLESFKPAPPAKKEEETPAPAAEAATESTEAPAATEEVAAAEAPAAEAAAEEPKKEELEKEAPAPKRRSASRKRTSIFGTLLGKKEEKKPVEAEAKPAETETPVAEAAAVPVPETPAAEPTAEPVLEAAPVAEAPAAEEPKTEEKKEEPVEAKPTPIKRTSIFGNLSFGKKKAPAAEPTPTEETPATTEAVAETAPVIPAVETTEPLSAEVSSPATVPTETVEVAPATNGETKKEAKNEKRKSSLPFAFGKKDKPTSDGEGESKPKSPSAFSKFRATIKGKGKGEKSEKSEEKAEETPAVPETAEAAKAEEPAAEEAPKPVEVEATPAVQAEEPAKPIAATPAVTAAA